MKHHGRYSFATYVKLVMVVALFAGMNTLFGDLFQALVGHYDIVYDDEILVGLVAYATTFAVMFWAADRKGTLGRLLGAKDEDK